MVADSNQTVCRNATINCPMSANCNISCPAHQACHDAKINWPIAPNGYGTISCLGYESCVGVNFPKPNPNIDYTLHCGGFTACANTLYPIYCPTNANCEIQCGWEGHRVDSACRHSQIIWSVNGMNTLECEGKKLVSV